MSAEIEGEDVIANLVRGLDRYKAEFAKEALRRVEEYTPTLTGHLKSGWQVTPTDNGSIEISNMAVNKEGVFYGPYVEFGTRHMHGFFMATRTIMEAEEISSVAKSKAGL